MEVNYNILNKIYEKCNQKIYCYMFLPADHLLIDHNIDPQFVRANNTEEVYLAMFDEYHIMMNWLVEFTDMLLGEYKDNIINLMMEEWEFFMNMDHEIKILGPCNTKDDVYEKLNLLKYEDLRKVWLEEYYQYVLQESIGVDLDMIKKIVPDENVLNKLILEHIKSLIVTDHQDYSSVLADVMVEHVEERGLKRDVIIFFGEIYIKN